MSNIKRNRLEKRSLMSHPGLTVGHCVPFYFCPRSVMLFVIFKANHPELSYRGGQDPLVHLEADLRMAVDWAKSQRLRWAFTLSNAGAAYFEDRAELSRLRELNWNAIRACEFRDRDIKEAKQAEFLVERRFPWTLIERIGVNTQAMYNRVLAAVAKAEHRPRVEILPSWYY